MLSPSRPENLVDAQGRPYFLWDLDMKLDEFRTQLTDPNPEVRAYFIAKLMRQAKPDDVFSFVTLGTIREQWSALERYLGDRREFWRWLLDRWALVERAR